MAKRTLKNLIRSRRGLALGAGVLAGLIGLAGVAQAGPWGHGRGGGRMMMHLVRDLDLSEQQEVEAVRMRRAIRTQMKAAKAETMADLTAATEEMKKEAPDRARLHGMVDGMIARFGKIAHSTLDGFLDFHAKLTPEQKAEVAERAERVQERMERRRQRFEDQD